jgi:uncharacterized protein YdeI (YjbR/CyaY-like superfamily)
MAESKTPILSFKEVATIEAYMIREPAESNGFWLKLSKIGARETTISKDEAIEAALCCGWIDGQLAKFDEHHFLIRMTPRRSGSRWSAKNPGTAERLAREGRLKAAGLGQIEQGRWAVGCCLPVAGESRGSFRSPGGVGEKRQNRALL